MAVCRNVCAHRVSPHRMDFHTTGGMTTRARKGYDNFGATGV